MALCQERTTGSKRPLLSKGDANAAAGQEINGHCGLDYLQLVVHKVACLLNGGTGLLRLFHFERIDIFGQSGLNDRQLTPGASAWERST